MQIYYTQTQCKVIFDFFIFVACPNGTYGKDCSENCPDGMYGELCSQRCQCKMNQQCNYTFGCLGRIVVFLFVSQLCSVIIGKEV